MKAAEQVFDVLERPLPRRGPCSPSRPLEGGHRVHELVLPTRPPRTGAAADQLLDRAGAVLAIAGRAAVAVDSSGVLLGSSRRRRAASRSADRPRGIRSDAWRSRLAWVPQRPHLFAATIDENVRLGRPMRRPRTCTAIHAARLDDVSTHFPTAASPGSGNGGGSLHRAAPARGPGSAYLRDAPLLLLDDHRQPRRPDRGDVLEAVDLVVNRTVVMVATSGAAHHRDRVVHLQPEVVPS